MRCPPGVLRNCLWTPVSTLQTRPPATSGQLLKTSATRLLDKRAAGRSRSGLRKTSFLLVTE